MYCAFWRTVFHSTFLSMDSIWNVKQFTDFFFKSFFFLPALYYNLSKYIGKNRFGNGAG